MPSFNNNNNNTNDNNNNRRFVPNNNNNGDVSFNNKVPTVDIYNLTATTLYTIPKSEVVHVPPQQQLPPAPAGRANATDGKGLTILQHTKKMTLCEHFNTAEGCRLGNRCPNVHARLTHPAVKINDDIHVNFAYFEPAHVKYYERFSEQRAPGDTANAPAHYWPKFLLVAPPNETSPVDEIPIKYCLKTAAFFKPGRIASHCAHFYYNRVCARGSRCFFVHAISFAGPRETNVMKHNSKHLKMHNNTNGNQQDDDVESCCSDDARAPENHEFEEVFIENEKGEKIKMNKIKSTTQVLEDGTPRRSWGRTQPFRDFGSGAFLKEFRKQQQQQQQQKGEQSLLPLPNSVAKQQQQQQVQQKIIITSQQQQLVVNVAPPLMQQQQITKPITSSLGFAAAFGGHSPALHNNARVNVVRSNGNASPMDSTYHSSNSSSMMMMGNFSPSSSPVIQQQQQQQQPQVFVLNNNLQLLQHQQHQNNLPHQQQQQQYFRGQQQQQQLNNNFANGYGLTPVSPAHHQQQQPKQQQHNPMMMINNNNSNNLMLSNQSFCSSAAQTPHCIDLTPKSDDGGLHNNHHNHHLLAMSSSSSASTTSSRCADDDVVFVKTPQAKKQQQNVVRVVRRSTTVPSSPSPSPKKKNCIQHNPYSWTKTTIQCSGF